MSKPFISALIAAMLCFLFNIGMNRTFCITPYEVTSSKIDHDFTGILITDLHGTEYGKDNCRLLEAVRAQHPDVIFMAGDIVNKSDTDFTKTIRLLKELGETAPVYYGFGNHEFNLKFKDGFPAMDEIRKLPGVHVIEYGVETAEIAGSRIKIGAFSVEPYNWEKYGAQYFQLFEDKNSFFILMSHYPWTIPDNYPETSTDVILSGHAHGGHVHLWDDIGLYSPEKGWFSRLTSGMHDIQGTTEIISRGLGDHTWVPRINNQPELVVIRFKTAKGRD